MFEDQQVTQFHQMQNIFNLWGKLFGRAGATYSVSGALHKHNQRRQKLIFLLKLHLAKDKTYKEFNIIFEIGIYNFNHTFQEHNNIWSFLNLGS